MKARVFDVRSDARTIWRNTGECPPEAQFVEAQRLEGLQQAGVFVDEETAVFARTFDGFLEDGE